LAEKAMGALADEAFFRRPAENVNSVALIVKHLGGNLRSRWTDFLASDGEKSWRDRDREFVIEEADTREALMAAWEAGWKAVLETVGSLTKADIEKSVTIRGEAHTVAQALVRGVTHAAYHVGQIMYLVRLLEPESAWLTIAPGKSGEKRGEYRKG
jgi:uncharacterized damage-inducible protein DinB